MTRLHLAPQNIPCHLCGSTIFAGERYGILETVVGCEFCAETWDDFESIAKEDA
ncbi:hypothetical protein [Stenotrophomonas virus Jojan60]|jgi:hypothetical protein|nr:hypothetical protein [Stenotrophomonas virus Jojan60]